MKKINYLFIGECIVIVCLLVVIGFLIKTDSGLPGKKGENTVALAKEAETEAPVGNGGAGGGRNPSEVGEAGRNQDPSEENGGKSEQELKGEEAVDSEQPAASRESTGQGTAAPGEEAVTNASNASTGKEEGGQTLLMSTREVIERNKKTQIVVFGDSIWNAERGADGISERIMAEKDVHIYNCAIGGTTAAVCNESTDWDSWTSNSFNGMMYITNDIISEDRLIPEDAASGIFKEIDFNQVDYIIVSYGLNDYFSDVPIHPQEYYDLTSFVGALRHGIHKIQEKYPNIEFILTSPTYTDWFEGERQFGLGDYVEAARGVSAEFGTHFLDMYHALGKNPQEKMQHLEDGVHLTEEGRRLYARAVIDFLTAQGIK